MFTTAGVTLATSVATSGVPGSTGGALKGAGVEGAAAMGGAATGPAARASCRWHPAPMPSASARKTGPNFRFVMMNPRWREIFTGRPACQGYELELWREGGPQNVA